MDQDEHMLKFSNMKCHGANIDESSVSPVHGEVLEVEHLLTQAKDDTIFMDGVLHSHDKSIGSLSRGFAFDHESKSAGGFDACTTCGEDILKLEVLDELLDGVDNVDDLHATYGLPCPSGDYFLDFEFSDQASRLGSGHWEGPRLANSTNSVSHSPGFSSTTAGGISESSVLPNPVSECKNDSFDEIVTFELTGAFRNACPRQSKVSDGTEHNSLGIHNPDELNYEEKPLIGAVFSDENVKSSLEVCQIGIVREKRLRKPTQRYIEEFSGSKSKEKVSAASTKNKYLTLRSCTENHHMRSKVMQKVSNLKPTSETGNMVLSKLQIQRGCRKKEELESDEESYTSESEDDYLDKKRSKKHGRRKQQRMWTLSEVIKLLDGISEYGVGRWTQIKRVLFSCSAYRTPIDLRDKWRNLLRASCVRQLNRKEARRKREHALHPLPNSVLHRVSELAKIESYPNSRCCK